jgi:phosphoenolpyruvate phosphomutase
MLARTVRSLEGCGISAVTVEDKAGPKRNSLYGNSVPQVQEDMQVFADKVALAASAADSPDFLVIARVESLILDKGVEDALLRATAYAKAGAHAVMIHSHSTLPDQVLEFARSFRMDHPHIPLVAVPTTYCQVTEAELVEAGFSLVIYANHLLRAAYPAMQRAASTILRHGRAWEIEDQLTPIPDFLRLFEEPGQ